MKANKPSRATGPKTAAGKSKSSKNAIQHGVTSKQVLPDERENVDSFIKELSSYYKPQSPLEVLQIQRIAFCRAKLSKLIDIEFAGRQIAQQDIESDPSKVLERLKQYPENLRALALKKIKGEDFLLEVHLDAKILEAIVDEFEGFSGAISTEDDLPKYFPKLCKHLRSVRFFEEQSESISTDQLLMILANKVNNLLETLEEKDSDGEFEQALRRVGRQMEADEMAARPALRESAGSGAVYHKAVLRDFEGLRSLEKLVKQLDQVIKSYEGLKEWLLRSVDLNNEEADRMMRYQTNLERRLSSAIGELLELQKQRPKI